MRTAASFVIVAALFVTPVHAGDVPLGTPFTLAVGEVVNVGDLPLTLEFEAVLSDSRCPRRVICVWEGEVTLRVRLETPRVASQSVLLHSRQSPLGPSQLVFDDHLVTLQEVRPYPEVPGLIPVGLYRADFVVSPPTALSPDLARWTAVKRAFR